MDSIKPFPLISVIVPNYNHAKYLPQRLNSILQQTYQNIEVIILDDSSTDDSKTVIENYRDNKLVSHIIFNKTNSGSTFLQWDLGIKKAKGEFIWIAESDDFCELNFLEELVSRLQKNTVLAYAQSFFVDDNDRIIYQSSGDYIFEHENGEAYIKKHMLYKNALFNASMCIWKKSCYEFISPEFLKYKYCGDWIFWNELVMQGNVLISGKLHNFYRRHQETVSANAVKAGEALKEELSAINYLSENISAFKANLQQIILVKIESNYDNELFIKEYNAISGTYPAMAYPGIKKQLVFFKFKNAIKKLLRATTLKMRPNV